MTDERTTRHLPLPGTPRSGRPADGRNGAGTSPAASATRAGWLLPTALILLSAVPMAAGAVRLDELAGGAAITPENARFFAAPLPVVAHIVCVSLYSVLGAFQFAPGFRRRRPGWHRAAGRLLIPCGLVAAATGLWMTLFYPRPVGDGDLLAGFRLVFGTAMIMAILLGLAAIRRRDIARHREWMIRGYAIGQGAGTQALTHLPWFLIAGTPGELPRALLVGAGWVINLAVAEWFIRRRPLSSPRTSASGFAGR
ncbi:DUF2306 domain-containing protein [Streptosporangium sp. NPDC049644]|uniref:DUF2306 domain-containing protein n=1 Tax=Streptosporangium sp. NPDC049644 TaxID=3155507 RepID=UPI00344186ED